MRVKDLIELLEDCDPEATVRLQTQANYPMEHMVAGICRSEKLTGEDDDDEGVAEGTGFVYVVEGSWIGYGSSEAWDRDNLEVA